MINKKVCVISTSLGGGGAERSSALLSQMLFDLGYNVSIAITKSVVEYNYSGKLFNLELEVKNKKNPLSKLVVFKKYLAENRFDYIIDNRIRNNLFKEIIFYKYVLKTVKTIAVVRSSHLKYYIPKSLFWGRFLYGNVFKVIAVSEKIKTKLESQYRLENVERIYNPTNSLYIQESVNNILLIDDEYILFFGRVEENVKNVSLLVNGYKNSKLIQKGIKLLILGDGPDVLVTKQMVKHLEIENNVIFIPFTPNPFLYVKEAIFTVLTSYFEGFPRSLVESLAMGTPVISVDCDSGPSEIIVHKTNGLLIENFNIEALSEAMNLFTEDEELYINCKENAIKSIEHLKIDNIALQWKQVLEN